MKTAALALLLFVSLAASRPARATESEARLEETLFVELGKIAGVQAKFQEEKSIALLKAPLRSEGTLHFMRGRGLARHTLAPQKQSLLVTPSALVFWDGKKTETIGLGSSPSLKAFAEAFSLLLAGDRRSLERSFRVDAEGDSKKAWTLRLTPKDEALKKMVSAIEVSGDGRVIARLVVREASGDVSTSTFRDVELDHRYDTKEADAVFRVPSM